MDAVAFNEKTIRAVIVKQLQTDDPRNQQWVAYRVVNKLVEPWPQPGAERSTHVNTLWRQVPETIDKMVADGTLRRRAARGEGGRITAKATLAIADAKPKKAAKKMPKKKTAKKKTTKKRSRAKAPNEVRLCKSPAELLGTYKAHYKLTQAQEEVRRASRDGKPIRTKRVIMAYDQLVRAAKSRRKAPRQAAAYFVAAELAKNFRRKPEIIATGKGDHPKLKEA